MPNSKESCMVYKLNGYARCWYSLPQLHRNQHQLPQRQVPWFRLHQQYERAVYLQRWLPPYPSTMGRRGVDFVVTPTSVAELIDLLDEVLRVEEARRDANLARILDDPEYGVWKSQQPRSRQINTKLLSSISAHIHEEKLSFEATVALWRGQTIRAPRPNKALNVNLLDRLLIDYPLRQHVVSAAAPGVDHTFEGLSDINDGGGVANHKSAQTFKNALYASIADGQASRAYLVVAESILKQWGGFHVSPFGCVPKADKHPHLEARVIHDLSFPERDSTNEMSNKSALPPVKYRHVTELARRIEALARDYPCIRIGIMKGDVKSAFRNIHVRPRVSRHFAGRLPELGAAVVDLALPFGWTGSPAEYAAFGTAISHLVRRESPHSLDPEVSDEVPFFGYEWFDDHVLIEVDTSHRLRLAELSLRMAMVAVLGPRSINESKFTSWSTQCKILGLLWDTTKRTVSIPPEKLQEARSRVQYILDADTVSKNQIQRVLGTLRHICSCIPPAKAFYQRLHYFGCNIKGYTRTRLSRGARLNLIWFDHILVHGRHSSIPTSLFAADTSPRIHLYMDSSDQGLCVLHPARRQYIRVKFDEKERRLIAQSATGGAFTINIREQLSAAFAILAWGQAWGQLSSHHPTVVQCWLDNTSAVSWCNCLSSPNSYAQELNRVIGACEAAFNVVIQASHLPGAFNRLADAGSRAWSPGTKFMRIWSNIVSVWQEIFIPSRWRQIYEPTSSPFNIVPSPTVLYECTPARGNSGVNFDRHGNYPNGFLPPTSTNSLFNWWNLQFTAGVNEFGRQLRAASIGAKFSHISWFHRVHRGFTPRLHPGHELVLAGMQRSSPPPLGRQPVTLDVSSIV